MGIKYEFKLLEIFVSVGTVNFKKGKLVNFKINIGKYNEEWFKKTIFHKIWAH
jgi:hypothetical protein